MVKKDLVNEYDLEDFQNFTLKEKINYFKHLERLMRDSKDSIFYQDNTRDKTETKFLLLDSKLSKVNLIFTCSNDREKDIFKLTLEIEKNNKVKKKNIINTTFKKVLKLSRLLGMESLFLTTVFILILMGDSKNILFTGTLKEGESFCNNISNYNDCPSENPPPYPMHSCYADSFNYFFEQPSYENCYR